jgi:hypothetical protein
MDNSLILSVQGLFLTLLSLLGTFFYVHLGNWRRDLIKLKAKWEQNKFNQTDAERAAVFEVRYELPGLANYVVPLVTGVVTAFIVLVAVLSLVLWSAYSGPPQLRTYMRIAGGASFALYLALTAIFLVDGLLTARELREEIDKRLWSE